MTKITHLIMKGEWPDAESSRRSSSMEERLRMAMFLRVGSTLSTMGEFNEVICLMYQAKDGKMQNTIDLCGSKQRDPSDRSRGSPLYHFEEMIKNMAANPNAKEFFLIMNPRYDLLSICQEKGFEYSREDISGMTGGIQVKTSSNDTFLASNELKLGVFFDMHFSFNGLEMTVLCDGKRLSDMFAQFKRNFEYELLPAVICFDHKPELLKILKEIKDNEGLASILADRHPDKNATVGSGSTSTFGCPVL